MGFALGAWAALSPQAERNHRTGEKRSRLPPCSRALFESVGFSAREERPAGAPRPDIGSAELLGQPDDDALRAAHEAEPVNVLVLRDLAHEFGTVAAQAS